ncbi:MAG: response regulator [Negativicutes bacterium]|nr:response regulator [Negativicutes bacterium]
MYKVLIVEDEAIIRQGLVYTIDWLSMNCVVVGEAENGAKGIRMIGELRPDIVLVDIVMPEMTGIEMLEQAQTLENVNFRAIVVTSHASFDFARQTVKLQVADYILKPIDEGELRRAVERAVSLLARDRQVPERPGTPNPVDGLINIDTYINNSAATCRYVAGALCAIRDNYAEKINIDTVASELGLSASYLSRKIKEATAGTFWELLMRYRLQKAVELMREGRHKMYHISEMTGFSDYKHFCVVFRKFMNMTPSEFCRRLGI